MNIVAALMLLIITSISVASILMLQNANASSTHMTFHNLLSNSTATLAIFNEGNCTAQPNSNCEVGAEYVWYTIIVLIPNKDNPQTTIEKLGVYGHCDVYLQESSGDYSVTHHCTAAEKAGLKPPASNQTK